MIRISMPASDNFDVLMEEYFHTIEHRFGRDENFTFTHMSEEQMHAKTPDWLGKGLFYYSHVHSRYMYS